MKKVRNAALKRSRNVSQQKLTVGLDLGDRNSWYCVVDEAGQDIVGAASLYERVAGDRHRGFGDKPRNELEPQPGGIQVEVRDLKPKEAMQLSFRLSVSSVAVDGRESRLATYQAAWSPIYPVSAQNRRSILQCVREHTKHWFCGI